MFKCCVCNSTSKKVDDETEFRLDDETESKEDASNGSSKLIASPVAADKSTESSTSPDKSGSDSEMRTTGLQFQAMVDAQAADKSEESVARRTDKPEDIAQKTDDEMQRAGKPDDEIQRMDTDDEIQRADKPDDEVQIADKSDDEIVDNLYEELQIIDRLDDEVQRADKPDDDQQGADKPEDDQQGADVQIIDRTDDEVQIMDQLDEVQIMDKLDNDEVQILDKLDDEVQIINKLDDEVQIIDKLDDEVQILDKVDDEVQIFDKLDDEVQIVAKLDDEVQRADKFYYEVRRADKADYDIYAQIVKKKPPIVTSPPIFANEFTMFSYESQDERSDADSSDSSASTVQEVVQEEADKTIVIDDEDSKLEGAVEDSTESAFIPEAPIFDPDTMMFTVLNNYHEKDREERTVHLDNDAIETESRTAVPENGNVTSLPRGLSEEEEEDSEHVSGRYSGMQEPPATPVARDELALRRHRFFSELLQVAQDSTGHRVRFDPLGPTVHTGCGGIGDREEYLEQLVNRLENVTNRLEKVPALSTTTQDIAIQTSSTSSPTPPRKDSSSVLDLPTLNIPFSQPSSTQSTSMSVAGYEDLLAGPVKEYLQLSQKIGGDVATHSKLVEKAFQIQLQFVQTAASRPAPTNQIEQSSLLMPMSAQIQQIQDFREKNRGSPFFNHLSAISESIPALGWVAVSPTPAPYVKEMNDAGQFYTNRVLKDWKEKNKIHIDWCKAWVQTLTDLQQYVRQHHTTGLVWAKTGAVPAGIPPPPPPSMLMGDLVAPPAINDDRSALFAQINQGEDITKSLKKVTSDMQTHKNPSLRSGPAPFKAPAVNAAPMKNVIPANAPIDKPPVFTRDGKKWLVEYHKGENLVIDNVEMNNVVYMFRCHDSTLTVKGKVNSVVMDSCRKSSVVFDSLVSSIEFVNCQSVQMQVLGKVPTISIDKTDGCQMYLNPESLGVELITSKSSEMNVMVPNANGDYNEYPVPEQFKTTINQNGLNTMAVDSLG